MTEKRASKAIPSLIVGSSALAEAKANLSAIVDDAQHNGRITVITKHGKKAAYLVPVRMVEERLFGKSEKPVMTLAEFEALSARFTAGESEPEYSAVQDLIDGRR